MALPESVLAQPASGRYTISVSGGDSVFLVDRCIGHRLYMGTDRPLPRPEFRRHVAVLEEDVRTLTIGELYAKYGLQG